MSDRFRENSTEPDFTFYSKSIKGKKKVHEKSKKLLNKYMYCKKCGGNPIIKIDNAKEYICEKCLKKYFKGKLKWKF